MLSYNKQLKALSQHLRKNVTDAENSLWLRLRRKDIKGGSILPPKDYRELYC
jgi:very-short-patch-repair endonuclease